MEELKHCAATRQLSPISEVCFLGRRPRRRGTFVVTLNSISLIKTIWAEEHKLANYYSIERYWELGYGLTSTRDNEATYWNIMIYSCGLSLTSVTPDSATKAASPNSHSNLQTLIALPTPRVLDTLSYSKHCSSYKYHHRPHLCDYPCSPRPQQSHPCDATAKAIGIHVCQKKIRVISFDFFSPCWLPFWNSDSPSVRESERIRQLPQSPRLRMEVLATHEESLWGAAWHSNDSAWLAELPRFHEFGKWPLGQLCIRVFRFIRGALHQISAEEQSTCLTVVEQTLPILGWYFGENRCSHTKLLIVSYLQTCLFCQSCVEK